MDDLYQFMSPLEGATNNANDRPSTKPTPAALTDETWSPSASASASASSRSSWSSWGASFNKFIEIGKKDMNEFVSVTRKDLTELAHTVQQERSTALETLNKKVEGLKTSLPPLPESVNTASSDILGKMSHVVAGLKQEITEAATGVSSLAATSPTTVTAAAAAAAAAATPVAKEISTSTDNKDEGDETGDSTAPTEGSAVPEGTTTTRESAPTSASAPSSAARSFASTASLFTAGANSLTQTLTSGTKEISSSANNLFKKTLPAVAEKHLGEADVFLKSTTETLKTNGLLAEQYVNKFGAGMANFINNAVVISPPEEKEVNTTRSKKMVFDRKAAILEKLRMDPETYTVDPMTTIADNDIKGLERYKYFLQTFNMAEYQQRISRMLNEYPELKALMNKLVPIEVADEELFWLRYHFRLYEIEEEEKRRKKLVQEVGADLAEDEFTWDDNEDEDEDEGDKRTRETTGGQGSVTPKAEKNTFDAVTPKANQTAEESASRIKREPLTAEALASSLSALPIPDESSTADDAKASGSDDEWGSESLKSSSSPSAQSFSIKSTATGAHSKSPTTNLSSTRTSEDAYEVVDGVETPIRAPLTNVTSLSSSATSPVLGAPAQLGSSKLKPAESKEEDDWSDWE
ncbi:hypothetical protein BG015_001799 [Linnemannia schmuckeri]|uniref:BSD domain-containing protein n=1 Tax=Linnemannia schmuckeri TaxID=64567 RepID=A0A9P5V6K6_9FUNG|nr:hypothetical protein BG015_001799 [Linnemannia schmuckeri]